MPPRSGHDSAPASAPRDDLRLPTDVLVVGGGVIGVSCAYELARRGVRVTLIDKGEIGHGCSYGNAGWITPSFAMPLPMPGMLFKALRWLIDRDSPLYIKPSLAPSLLRWLLRFVGSMNRRQMLRSVAALTELSRFSLDEYVRLDREFPGAFGLAREGLLMAAETAAGLRAAARQMELVARHGIPGRLLDEEACRALEPAIAGRLAGAVHYPDEAHAEPLQVVETLAGAARQRGARLVPNTEVFGIRSVAGPAPGGGRARTRRIVAVQTTRGEIAAEQVLLAAGSWSAAIGRELGLRVPVLGGKGYSLTLRAPGAPMPRLPLMILEKKVAVTPRRGALRIAGTLELVDQDQSITWRRVQNLVRAARGLLALPPEAETVEVWRGLRPCTPDGVPIIGRAPRYANLLLATGHQMLGLQSAPGTARLAADLVTGAPPAFDPRPFRAERF